MATRDFLRRSILEICRSLAIEISDHVIPKKSIKKTKKVISKKPKRLWVRSNILERQMQGTSLLRKDLSEDNTDGLMPPDLFEFLLRKVNPIIRRQDTTMRMALSSRLKLQITLRFLTLGYTYRKLEDIYSVPRSSISHFIKEVLDAISEVLAEYGLIQAPQSVEHWLAIQEDFMLKRQFPFCCGALGGRHIYIKNPPQGAPVEDYKHQGTFSIVMLALVDANYKFIHIDVGKNGRQSHTSVFNRSSMDDVLTNRTMNFPPKAVFVANEVFPLREDIMTPYPTQYLTDKQAVFNHRLDRCQRAAENALGIMVSKFKIFEKPQNLALDKVESIIRTCVILHNWLLANSPDYIEPGLVDEEDTMTGNITHGSWRNNTNNTGIADIDQPISNSFPREDAAAYREELADYFLIDEVEV